MRRFDWHAVTFWSCLGIAVVYVGIAATSKDGKILTIFDEDGRQALKKGIRYNHPELAKWLGIEK